MYNVSVPIINITAEEMGLEKHLEMLKRLDAKRVFLAINSYYLSKKRREKEMTALKKNCEFFKKHGFEVGAWLWTFMVNEKNDYVHMKGASGKTSHNQICPSDKRFRKFAGEYLADIAACGVDLIQFDDDFRYGTLDIGMSCFCENHIAYMENILGEKLNPQELPQLILKGEGNKYRSAWLKAKRHNFEVFAKEMREAVDAVNPKIRLGNCSCLTVWDIDGIDSASISKILAGDTEPFLRLIGAPYWAVSKAWGNRLQNIIELERMERSWCSEGIEIYSEGDVYPRPRTNCPASYLEIFDTALRASGELDGILKYGVDYISNTGYENGYIERHEKHRSLYSEIDRLFGDKKACGVRIYERMTKFEDMVLPANLEGDSAENIFFSPASKMIVDNSIPSVYEGFGVCGIAFAENVKAVPAEAFKKGLIIDIRAAQLLQQEGIDTGLLSVGEKYWARREYFDTFRENYALGNDVYEIEVNKGAKILSHFISFDERDDEKSRSIGAYYYKNKEGQQFLVFAFAAYEQSWGNDNFYRSYARSRQLKEAIDLFGGEKLPAYSYGNPDLYIIAKKTGSSMSVGLWNIFPDEIFEPIVELDREYSEIEFINCSGRLEGSRVYLCEMAPYSFAGFEVK